MRVFISHAGNSREARDLADALAARGAEPWLDEWFVYPGDDWAAAMSKGLGDAEAMVVLLSPESLASPAVRRDLGYALTRERFAGHVLPVALPGTPTDEIPWVLRKIGVIDGASSAAETAQSILAALGPRAEAEDARHETAHLVASE